VKKLLAALLVFALVAPLTAGVLSEDVATQDGNQQLLTAGSYFTLDSGVEAVRYSVRTTAVMDTLSDTDTLAVCRTTINPSGIPGWFNFQIPEEATLTSFHIKFFERDQSLTVGYTAGSWANYYVGETYKRDAFQVAGWDSAWAVFTGTGDGKFNFYWWTENFKN
jgi:hypothetical protein